MANISKAALVDELKETTGMNQKETKALVDGFLEQLTHHLKAGNKVQLTGFGSFELRERSARTGINPATKTSLGITRRQRSYLQ